jgi:hypothetical protein
MSGQAPKYGEAYYQKVIGERPIRNPKQELVKHLSLSLSVHQWIWEGASISTHLMKAERRKH